MAAPPKTGYTYSEKVSYVAQDMIWKDHVSKIEKAQRVYDRKWGYLHDGIQPVPADPRRTMRNSTANLIDNEHEKLTVNPSPRPIPSTTNRFIGWRTTDQRCTLEKYGKYARGQESMHKKFKWPIEGFD